MIKFTLSDFAKDNSPGDKSFVENISFSWISVNTWKALSVIFFILITFYLQKSETLVDPSTLLEIFSLHIGIMGTQIVHLFKALLIPEYEYYIKMF